MAIPTAPQQKSHNDRQPHRVQKGGRPTRTNTIASTSAREVQAMIENFHLQERLVLHVSGVMPWAAPEMRVRPGGKGGRKGSGKRRGKGATGSQETSLPYRNPYDALASGSGEGEGGPGDAGSNEGAVDTAIEAEPPAEAPPLQTVTAVALSEFDYAVHEENDELKQRFIEAMEPIGLQSLGERELFANLEGIRLLQERDEATEEATALQFFKDKILLIRRAVLETWLCSRPGTTAAERKIGEQWIWDRNLYVHGGDARTDLEVCHNWPRLADGEPRWEEEYQMLYHIDVDHAPELLEFERIEKLMNQHATLSLNQYEDKKIRKMTKDKSSAEAEQRMIRDALDKVLARWNKHTGTEESRKGVDRLLNSSEWDTDMKLLARPC